MENNKLKLAAKSENKTLDNQELHPFGGCKKLASQYQIIGRELLCFEMRGGFYQLGTNTKAETIFRQAVSFIPVEVLDSYLEDLLNLDTADEFLAIQPSSWWRRARGAYLSIGGILIAILSGLYAATLGAALSVAFALAISLAVPFATILYLCAGGTSRRIRFAQVLSREVARRRGLGDKGGMGVITGATVRLRELLNASTPQSAAGASFDIVH